MARIVGNLTPEDDYTHALGPELNFNESMYFNFFDPERSLGGFVRLGNRANEGRAEMTVTLYLPDGRVLFGFERYVDPKTGAWREHAAPDGSITSEHLHATSVYHVWGALSEVVRVKERASA